MNRIALLVVLSMFVLQGCSQHGLKPGQDKKKAAQIYSDLGLGYLGQGKVELALTKLKRSLQLDNKQVEAHHYIAEVYNQLEEYELADAHYTKAVSLAPPTPMLLNNYGAFLCERSRFEDAEKYFLRAATTKRYRSPELAYENLALCALRTKNTEKAETYFRKALGMNAGLPKSLYQMARLNYDKKDYLRARAFLQRFQSVSNDTERSLKLGIHIEKALGSREGEKEYQEKLRRLFPHADSE